MTTLEDMVKSIVALERRVAVLETVETGSFVRVAPFFIYDNSAVQWNAVQKNTGTYRFNMTDANNALPTGIRAVAIRVAMVWNAAADGTFFYTREYNGTAVQLAMRSLVANITSNAAGIQTVDTTNYAFELLINGANNTSGTVLCYGYFV